MNLTVANPSQDERKPTCIKLNSQTTSAFAKATARRVLASWHWLARHSLGDGGSRLTKDAVGDFFTLNTRIAFGHGSDCSGYDNLRVRNAGKNVNVLHSQNRFVG